MLPLDVAPFWRAVLGGYVDRDDEYDLIDPHWRQPAINFGQMDVPRPQRNRIHINLYVPYDQAEPRIRAALAAGGHIVTDQFAPSWWVLADSEGKRSLCRPDRLGSRRSHVHQVTHIAAGSISRSRLCGPAPATS